jgi:hypothetical protein
MKTYRVTLSAPKSHFEISYDLDVSIEEYEFWGQKYSVKEHEIVNAKSEIEVPKSWKNVNYNSNDVHHMACGDIYCGEFSADIPAAAFHFDDEEEWIDALADSLPSGWDIVNWKTIEGEK